MPGWRKRATLKYLNAAVYFFPLKNSAKETEVPDASFLDIFIRPKST